LRRKKCKAKRRKEKGMSEEKEVAECDIPTPIIERKDQPVTCVNIACQV
jgi:hypothetical protein